MLGATILEVIVQLCETRTHCCVNYFTQATSSIHKVAHMLGNVVQDGVNLRTQDAGHNTEVFKIIVNILLVILCSSTASNGEIRQTNGAYRKRFRISKNFQMYMYRNL